MKSIVKKIKDLWNDESAQGATEYILLLVVVAAIGLIFKGAIIEAMKSKIEDLKSAFDQFKTSG